MLDACLESACSGQATVAIIRGEAGMGKTRLAETMIDRARRSDVLVVVGHCTPVSGGELPFGPFVQMLSQIAAAPRGLEETAGTTWDQLKAVMTVPGRSSGVAAPDVGLERSRLFTSVLWALHHLGETQTVMVVIEDIHWADSSSLDLLNYLARTAAQKRLLVLLTCRDEALSRSPITRRAVGDLSRASLSRQIQLHPLTPAEVRQLIAASDVSLRPAESDRVIELCDGNPFLALELSSHDGIDGAGAETLRELLLGPIDELPDDARFALHVAAVLGPYIPHSVLEYAIADSSDSVAGTLRLLTERGFLVNGPERYHFRHAILRESVIREMLHSEQTAAHRAAVRGIRMARFDEVPVGLAQLAHHLVGAEDHPAALAAVMAAADYAQRVYAFAEARRHLSIARKVLWSRVDSPEELSGVSYQDLLCREAEMARCAGQPSAAAALLREGIDGAATRGVDRAHLEHELGEALWAAGDPAASLASYRRGEAALGADTDDPGLRARLLAALARGQIVTGQYVEATTSAQRAISVAERAGSPRDALQARITLATAIARQGQLEPGTAQLRQCLTEALSINAFQAVVRCYGNLAFLHSTAGRLADVLEIGADAARTCQSFGPLLLVAPTLAENWVHALVATGRWDEADELAHRLQQEWTAEGMALALHLQLALIPAARGDDEGFQREMAIIEDVARPDDPYGLHGVAAARAEHLLWQGEPAEALRIASDTLGALADQQDAGLVDQHVQPGSACARRPGHRAGRSSDRRTDERRDRPTARDRRGCCARRQPTARPRVLVGVRGRGRSGLDEAGRRRVVGRCRGLGAAPMSLPGGVRALAPGRGAVRRAGTHPGGSRHRGSSADSNDVAVPAAREVVADPRAACRCVRRRVDREAAGGRESCRNLSRAAGAADAARTRCAPAAHPRLLKPADRATAVHRREHRQRARLPHHREARGIEPPASSHRSSSTRAIPC